MQNTLALHREPESYDTSPLGVLAQSLRFFPKLLQLLVPHLAYCLQDSYWQNGALGGL